MIIVVNIRKPAFTKNVRPGFLGEPSGARFILMSTKVLKTIVKLTINVIFFRYICHSNYNFISLHMKNLNKYNIFQ